MIDNDVVLFFLLWHSLTVADAAVGCWLLTSFSIKKPEIFEYESISVLSPKYYPLPRLLQKNFGMRSL